MIPVIYWYVMFDLLSFLNLSLSHTHTKCLLMWSSISIIYWSMLCLSLSLLNHYVNLCTLYPSFIDMYIYMTCILYLCIFSRVSPATSLCDFYALLLGSPYLWYGFVSLVNFGALIQCLMCMSLLLCIYQSPSLWEWEVAFPI